MPKIKKNKVWTVISKKSGYLYGAFRHTKEGKKMAKDRADELNKNLSKLSKVKSKEFRVVLT